MIINKMIIISTKIDIIYFSSLEGWGLHSNQMNICWKLKSNYNLPNLTPNLIEEIKNSTTNCPSSIIKLHDQLFSR